jgi:hypothetical protein
VPFCIDFCQNFKAVTFEMTHRLLSYARDLLRENPESTDQYHALMSQVFMSLKRLCTYQILSEQRCPSIFSSQEWQDFRCCNIVDEISRLLQQGNFHQAILIWKRHFIEERLADHSITILNAVPEFVALEELLPWLQYNVFPLARKAGLW